MPASPNHKKFVQLADSLREDEALADQFLGALETLRERARDDPVVATCLPNCVKFRLLMRSLLKNVNRYVAATEDADDAVDPAKAKFIEEEWQEARTLFHDEYRRHKVYLEKLALRLVK